MRHSYFADNHPGPSRRTSRWLAAAALALVAAGCARTPTAAPSAAVPARAAKPALAALPADLGLGDWTVPDRYRGKLVTARVRYFPRKLLALTFDDGPDPTLTPQVLKTLATYRAHATFFVLGGNAQSHLGLLRQMAAAGHAVGSHSYQHLYKATPAQAESNLDKTAEVIERGTGRRPTLFRPPGGFTDGALARLAREQGYAVILWTISSADTTKIGPEVIARNVIHTPNPGDIVLMHDGAGHGRTIQALPQILRELGAAGFQFVTVPELLRAWTEWLATNPSGAAPAAAPGRGRSG